MFRSSWRRRQLVYGLVFVAFAVASAFYSASTSQSMGWHVTGASGLALETVPTPPGTIPTPGDDPAPYLILMPNVENAGGGTIPPAPYRLLFPLIGQNGSAVPD